MKNIEMNTLLEEAIEAWQNARNGVIAEVENIPANQTTFRPVEGVRNFAEVVVHIMEVSMMMVGELCREDTNLRRMPFPKMIAHYGGDVQGLRTKNGLIEALRRTLKHGVKEFRRAGELHMLQRIQRFDGQLGTRLAWMHHGIDQEMYHRGQLAIYQRLMGITPALTKLIRGTE
jgi:uncharacterized damage-inducible protein DinB